MSRPQTRFDFIPLDVVNDIKEHCWGSLSAFYKKYKDELDMSLPTFYRVIEGGYCTQANVQQVMNLVEHNKIRSRKTEVLEEEIRKLKEELSNERFKIASDRLNNQYYSKMKIIKELFSLVETYCNNATSENLQLLKEFMSKYRLSINEKTN